MTASAATSSLRLEDAKLLEPYASNLAHLADTIRDCQDALSGFSSDGSAMVAINQYGRMTIQSAASAVRDCLSAALRAFNKPFRVATAPSEASWSVKMVREAKETLLKELEVLVSSPLLADDSLHTSTPDRVSA